MSTINIAVTDTNAQRQTKIDAAVGGDNVVFAVGTHLWAAGEFNRLMGTTTGGTAITYKPAGAGVILKKEPSTKTAPIFTDQDNNGSANVHHNVVIDGTVSAAADMTFDGAGIQVKTSWQQAHQGWKIHHCKMKNFTTGANGDGGYGSWWYNTCNMPALEFHHNLPSNSIVAGREGYWLFIHVYNDMDDLKIYNNTLTDVYQGFNITCHVSDPSKAPTGFRMYKNIHNGIQRAFIEFLGIGDYWLNPMFYLNEARGWKANSTVPLDTYGLSLVCDHAYGGQVFGNVMDGGRVIMQSTLGPTGVRIANESSEYYETTFANLFNGTQTGWYRTGGGGHYCYGNTISNILQAGGSIQVGNAASNPPNPYPVFDITRAADSGTTATATVTVAAGKVTDLTITNAGTNFKKQLDANVGYAAVPPKVTISGDGTGAKVFAYVNPATFVVEGFIIMNGGSGYTSATATIARTAISEPNTLVAAGNTDYPIEAGGSAPPAGITITVRPTPSDGLFLSDNTSWWLSGSTNGSGPFELDRSNGSDSANDGITQKIGYPAAIQFNKGIGSFSPATIKVDLTGKRAIRFKAEVGIDNEITQGSGSVVFQVVKDLVTNPPSYSSPVMVSGNSPQVVDIDITGWTTLFLIVNSQGSNTNDSADWGHARIVQSSASGTKTIDCVTVNHTGKVLTKLYNDNTTSTEQLT